MHSALATPAGLKSQGKDQREAPFQQINPWEIQSRVLPVHPSIPSIMKNDLRHYSSTPRQMARTCTCFPSATHPKLFFALTVTVAMETVLTSALREVPHARSKSCAWCHRSCSPNSHKTVGGRHTQRQWWDTAAHLLNFLGWTFLFYSV